MKKNNNVCFHLMFEINCPSDNIVKNKYNSYLVIRLFICLLREFTNRHKYMLIILHSSSLVPLSVVSNHWVNSAHSVGIGISWCESTLLRLWVDGADWARTANKSPPAVLKWRGCDWEGEGSREQGLMNTGHIDLLPPAFFLTPSTPLLSGQMLLQHFSDLPH